jgi:hypothetical protein
MAIALFSLRADALAQAAGEYAGAVSGMSAVGAKAGTVDKAIIAIPAASQGAAAQKAPAASTTHLSTTTQLAGEDVNRKELEDAAGEDGGKLLLRSKPTKATVWIGGKRVGSTPLLLMLAPGQYRVELRGDRQELAEQKIDLQPRETREVVVTLEPRYPSLVRLPKAPAQ